MSKGNNSPGISRLAGLFNGMAKEASNGERIIDLGTIQSDKSLITDTFKATIPKSDYLVLSQLKKTKIKTSKTDGHTHDVEPQEELKPGDRVLVAWVSNDAVIIGKILTAADAL